jgi:hypothetical protein
MTHSRTVLHRSISLTASMSVGALAVVALATNASAEPSCTTDASGITCSYGGSGSTDIILPDVNTITLTVKGGGGGGGSVGSGAGPGGSGAQVSTAITVSPCDVLTVYVGGGGGSSSHQGGSGYGQGGGGFVGGSGGGGGASGALLNGTPTVVAGGGGGGTLNRDGGDGGNPGLPGSGLSVGGGGGANGAYGTGGSGGGSNGSPGFAGSGGEGIGGGGGAGFGGGGGGGYDIIPAAGYGGGGGGGSYSSTAATFTAAGNGGVALADGGNGSVTFGFDTNAHPCGYIAPVAPVLQEVGLGANANCETLDDTALNWGGAESGNWGTSWAEWPNDHQGGAVCERTLTYSHAEGHWVSS